MVLSTTSLRFIDSLQVFRNLIRNKVRGKGGESYEAKTSVARQIALLGGMFPLLVTHLLSSFPKFEFNVNPSLKMHDQPSFSSTAAHSALHSGYTHSYNQNKIHILMILWLRVPSFLLKERSLTMVARAFHENPCRLLRLLWIVRGKGGVCPFSTTERTLDDGYFLLSSQSRLDIVKQCLFFRPSRIRATYGMWRRATLSRDRGG